MAGVLLSEQGEQAISFVALTGLFFLAISFFGASLVANSISQPLKSISSDLFQKTGCSMGGKPGEPGLHAQRA